VRILVYNWKDLAHPAAGGAEVYTHEVTRRWAARGHDVTLFCAAVPGRPATEDVAGVTVVRAGGRIGVYGAARRFHRGGRAGRFDLVVDEVNTRPFGCARWVRDAPVVGLIHQLCREIWFHELPWPLAALGRYALEPAWLRAYRDVPVLTVSPSSRDSLRAAGLRDVTVVPAGVVRRPRPPVQREPHPTVVFVGRLVANKGPADALAAFRLLRRRLPGARLWFVGDGPLRPALARHAPPGVHLFGRVGTARRDELLARAHALVATSVREGWGLVVDEAAAMGTPTVGYDRPGLRDSVRAAGGVLVRPDPAALAETLAARLPGWTATPAATGWSGGAADWDTVADAVLDRATERAGLARVPAVTERSEVIP
jgi:glycosyltransferase involved in cell wall biosynthesis